MRHRPPSTPRIAAPIAAPRSCRSPRRTAGSTWRAVASLSLALALAAAVGTGAAALTLAVTAETGFQPRPCDCPVDPLGGWAPRDVLFRTLEAEEPGLVRLDVGGWLAGDIGLETARVTLEAMDVLGYDVLNVGPAELDLLQSLGAERHQLPLVCGHPDRPDDVPAWRTVAHPDGRIAVIGAGWFGSDVRSPAEQVAAALAAMSVSDGGGGAADVVVVLCAGGLGPARAVARANAAVDVVLYGSGGRTPNVVDLGGAAGGAPGLRGRQVGLMRGTAGGDWAFELRPVHPDVETDPELDRLALRAAYLEDGAAVLRERFAYRSR